MLARCRWILTFVLAAAAPALAGPTQTVPCGLPGVTVTYDPFVSAGTPAILTIQNGSAQDLQFWSNCWIGAIYAGGTCTGQPISPAYCGPSEMVLAAGASATGQSPSSTYFLTPGPYFVAVAYGVGGVVHSCCLPITIQPGVFHYGVAKPGTGGWEPVLAPINGTAPKIGTTLDLRVGTTATNVPGVLFVGIAETALPVAFGTLLVAPNAAFIVLPISIDEPLPFGGGSTKTLSCAIPNNPALVGATAFLQAIVQDPGAAGGYSHTSGLRITIGN